MIIVKEKVQHWIDAAYKTACEHGFHEKEMGNEHYMMLVASEVGEAVEADRKCRHADIESYEDEISYGADVYDKDARSPFEKYIKDSVEDELADVCIRMFDFMGMRGLTYYPLDTNGTMWNELEERGFCSQCFEIIRALSPIRNTIHKDVLKFYCNNVLNLCFFIAENHDIDLESHIDWKMTYNSHRPAKHGKNY